MMKNYMTLLSMLFVPFALLGQNVGIGTTAPAYKLDVRSDTLTRALNVYLDSQEPSSTLRGLQSQVLGHGTGSAYGGYFISNTTGDGDTYGLQSQVFTNGAGYSYGLKAINQTSNIGGTSNGNRYGLSSSVSSVAGGSMTAVLAQIEGQSTLNRAATALYGIVDEFATGGSSYAIRGVNNNADGYSAWLQGKARIVNGELASLSSGGYLQIGNSGEQNLVFDGNEIMARNNGSASTMYLQYTGGNILMCPLSSGQVAIGVFNDLSLPSSDYRLAVNGKGIFEEVRVDLKQNWPDYVFDEKYEMLPLEKLSEYVSSNKHLPNIPSAKDVKENGLMLGEMQYKMMEKIEELTLYIIEQNERIKALEAQIK